MNQLYKFSDFLKNRNARFKPNDAKKLRLKRIDKIDFSGNIYLSDKNTNTDMIMVRTGDLVISGINVEKGAMSIYQGEEDVLATIHYSSYEYDPKIIDIDYLKLLMKSPIFKKLINSATIGGIKTEIKPKHILLLKINLPKVAEQELVVSKTNSILNSNNKLAEQNEELLSQIKKLKQSILQDTIQGKLVPQDPKDEPAEKLLEKIKIEKEKLIRDGKMKKEKSLTLISPKEIPFNLPKGWIWSRIADIAFNLGQKKPDKKFTYIDVGSIDNKLGKISSEVKILEKHDAPSRARKVVDIGCVIYSSVRPYLKNIAIIDKKFEFESIASTAFFVLKPLENIVHEKYLYYYLLSDIFNLYVMSKMIGMAYPAINDKSFYSGLIPLPSYDMQERIVERVESLTKLCDELEMKISESQKNTNLLMQSVLQEAFNLKN